MDVYERAPGSEYIDKDFGHGVVASLNINTHVFAVFQNAQKIYQGIDMQSAAKVTEDALRFALYGGAIEIFSQRDNIHEDISSSFQDEFMVREPSFVETFISMILYRGPRLGDARRRREKLTLGELFILCVVVSILVLVMRAIFYGV